MTLYNKLKEADNAKLFHHFFPRGSQFHEQHDSRGQLATVVVETPPGRPNFQIIYSYFIAVAEIAPAVIARINTARRLFATMALNREAGLVTSEHFESERTVMRSYLMRLCGLDGTVDAPSGSYRDAHNTLMPEGFFGQHFKRGVRTVASHMGGVE